LKIRDSRVKNEPDGSRCAQITRARGTYLLILRAETPLQVQVGRWGMLDVRPGYYMYVGSAFGPGGIAARVLRHCRRDKLDRWHIDYLRKVTAPLEVWCGCGPRELEHRWAQLLCAMRSVSSIPRFGCSDCHCESHLFASAGRPDFQRLAVAAGARLEVCPLD
jgi:Uri superfamily endonuclease